MNLIPMPEISHSFQPLEAGHAAGSQVWFLMKLVYRIDCGKNCESTDFDEQYRIICAATELEASAKARFIGVRNEIAQDYDQGGLRWIFIDALTICRIPDEADGMELFSTTYSTEHPDDYIRFIRHRASHSLKQQNNHTALAE